MWRVRMKRGVGGGLVALGVWLGGLVGGVSAQSGTAEVRPGDLGSASAGSSSDVDLARSRDEVRANIELWERRIRKKFDDVEHVLDGLDLKKIEAQARVAPDLKQYREALLKAPQVFRKLADTMDERAGKRKAIILKEAYADISAEARKLATTYETKAKLIDKLETELQEKIEFVVDSREFIADARELLAAIPTEHGLQTEKLVERLNKYLEVFQDAVKTIRGVTEKIGEPSSPGAVPAQPGRPGKPLSSDELRRPDRPLNAEQYRRLLAELRKS